MLVISCDQSGLVPIGAFSSSINQILEYVYIIHNYIYILCILNIISCYVILYYIILYYIIYIYIFVHSHNISLYPHWWLDPQDIMGVLRLLSGLGFLGHDRLKSHRLDHGSGAI